MKYINKFICMGLSIGLSFTGTYLSFGYFKDIAELDTTITISQKLFQPIEWEIEYEYISYSKSPELYDNSSPLQDKYILNIPYKLSGELYLNEELKINVDTSELTDKYEVSYNYDLENEKIEIQIINNSKNEELKLPKFEESNIANLPKVKISASILTNDGSEEIKLQDYYVYIGMKDNESLDIVARVYTEPLKIENEVIIKEDKPVNSEVIEQSNKENKPVRPSIEEQSKEENSVKPGAEEQSKEENSVKPGAEEPPKTEEKPVEPGVAEPPKTEEKPVESGVAEPPKTEEKLVESEVVQVQNKSKVKILK